MIAVFFFAPINNSQAQYTINKTVQEEQLIISTMDLIYNFDFEQAHKQISEVKKRFPNHPIYHFLSAMCCYWEMVPISINNSKYKIYEHHLLKTMELAQPLLSKAHTKPEAGYYMIASQSSMVVIYLKANDFSKAIAEGRKTYWSMKEGFGWTEKYPDFNFTTGLYYFYAAQYPETHPAFQPLMWFFTKGDKEKGIALLKKSAEKSLFSKTESDYFLAHVYLKYYSFPLESIKYSQKLIQRYPNNYFYMARYVEGLVLAKKYVEAKPLTDKLLKSPIDYFQIAGHLFSGLVDVGTSNLLTAKKHFEIAQKTILASDKQTNDYQAFVYWGLGMLYEKENNAKKASYYFGQLEEVAEYKLHQQETEAYKRRRKLARKND